MGPFDPWYVLVFLFPGLNINCLPVSHVIDVQADEGVLFPGLRVFKLVPLRV